eukprot:Em0007g882a
MKTFVLQDGWSPLHEASWKGHLGVVKTLLEAGANINQATEDGRTSLDLAVEQGHKATIQLLKTYPNKVTPPTLVQYAKKRAARDEQAPSKTKLLNKALVIPQAQQTQEGAKKAEENTTPEHEILKPMQQNDMFQLQITHQAQHANERARIAEVRATRVEQELSETKLHYEALLQQADEKAKRADKRANQELLETKQHYDALQQQIRLQVQLSEERATRAEQELLEIKRQRDAMQQQARVQVQNADERARRAEERARTAEKEHLETKQQRDAMQQQIRLQVQRADERARRAEERARTAEREHLETKQQRDAMQQQIRLQVQQADERAARAEQQIPDYMKSSWRVERDEIEETGEEPLGVGGWGEVRVATFRGARVAAKLIHNAIISPHNINLFLREMHMAASVRHPNLLLFIGASLDDNKPVILTELMPTNLRSIIVALPQDHVITIGMDVARGLNYLHLMRPDPIIHRDVSSANVLLEPIGPGNWKAKVSDYGSANFLSKVRTMGPGNASYAAPESFNPKLQSPKMDVYSYGILLLEMATGQFPDHKLQAMQLDTLPWQEMAMMIRRCICDDPASRPTMKDLLPDLTDLDK